MRSSKTKKMYLNWPVCFILHSLTVGWPFCNAYLKYLCTGSGSSCNSSLLIESFLCCFSAISYTSLDAKAVYPNNCHFKMGSDPVSNPWHEICHGLARNDCIQGRMQLEFPKNSESDTSKLSMKASLLINLKKFQHCQLQFHIVWKDFCESEIWKEISDCE